MRRLLSFLFERLIARKLWAAWRGCIDTAAVPGCGGTAFFGDSLTHNARWDLIFPDARPRNFGIGGERSEHLLLRLEPLIRIRPDRVFLLIGSNDLAARRTIDAICADVEAILEKLQAALPGCPIYLQTVIPRSKKLAAPIRALNQRYAEIAARRGVGFIDLFPAFDDGSGLLRKEFTYDAIHLTGTGYEVWRGILSPYITGGQP